MSKYDKIDALIVAKCAIRQRTFSELRYNTDIGAEADSLAAPDYYGRKDGYRVVDRRLQALRKAGKLTFSHATGWEAAK